MSSRDWEIRKVVTALVPGQRFVFASELGGEGQTLTTEGQSNLFGTVSVSVEELDEPIYLTASTWVTVIP